MCEWDSLSVSVYVRLFQNCYRSFAVTLLVEHPVVGDDALAIEQERRACSLPPTDRPKGEFAFGKCATSNFVCIECGGESLAERKWGKWRRKEDDDKTGVRFKRLKKSP